MRYIHPDPTQHWDEAGYHVEDGILVDADTKPNHQAFDYWTRYWRPTSDELRAEEAAWAARSGPVTVRRVQPLKEESAA